MSCGQIRWWAVSWRRRGGEPGKRLSERLGLRLSRSFALPKPGSGAPPGDAETLEIRSAGRGPAVCNAGRPRVHNAGWVLRRGVAGMEQDGAGRSHDLRELADAMGVRPVVCARDRWCRIWSSGWAASLWTRPCFENSGNQKAAGTKRLVSVTQPPGGKSGSRSSPALPRRS